MVFTAGGPITSSHHQKQNVAFGVDSLYTTRVGLADSNSRRFTVEHKQLPKQKTWNKNVGVPEQIWVIAIMEESLVTSKDMAVEIKSWMHSDVPMLTNMF